MMDLCDNEVSNGGLSSVIRGTMVSLPLASNTNAAEPKVNLVDSTEIRDNRDGSYSVLFRTDVPNSEWDVYVSVGQECATGDPYTEYEANKQVMEQGVCAYVCVCVCVSVRVYIRVCV